MWAETSTMAGGGLIGRTGAEVLRSRIAVLERTVRDQQTIIGTMTNERKNLLVERLRLQRTIQDMQRHRSTRPKR